MRNEFLLIHHQALPYEFHSIAVVHMGRIGCNTYEARYLSDMDYVSTHTPLWSVTCGQNITTFQIGVSTHTPLRGVTDVQQFLESTDSVSTHTPLRGVTIDPQRPWDYYNVSTHTPLRGVTSKPEQALSLPGFLLIHPYGV